MLSLCMPNAHHWFEENSTPQDFCYLTDNTYIYHDDNTLNILGHTWHQYFQSYVRTQQVHVSNDILLQSYQAILDFLIIVLFYR